MGELTREVAFDPWSIELHLGDQKPTRRAWVEPQRTDHMFFGKPSAEAKNIAVQVTDRFKNVYKKEASLSALVMG
jgi:hypothetical protein